MVPVVGFTYPWIKQKPSIAPPAAKLSARFVSAQRAMSKYTAQRLVRKQIGEGTNRTAARKTEILELDSFRGYLAWMYESSYNHPEMPFHYSLFDKIINNCNPGIPPIHVPGVGEARLVVVDDRPLVSLFNDAPPNHMRDWWPMAQSDDVARKLRRRIRWSGYVLPVLTAMACALMSKIYSSPWSSGGRRFRLQYRSSPITDFGISLGSAKAVAEDRLMFYSMKNKRFAMLPQDPDQHYRLYFTTLKGEEIYFDGGAYTFNLARVVFVDAYIPPNAPHPISPEMAPCHWEEREFRTNKMLDPDSLFHERTRVSVLRSEKLQRVIERSDPQHVADADLAVFFTFMEEFSRKKLDVRDKILFDILLGQHCKNLEGMLEKALYRDWPARPPEDIDLDPYSTSALNDLTWGRDRNI
ncbi:hypothetical protein EIP91_002861 [Steccherinum ochraceum]|uniref:Uncharacterized protein n=1 Tax=Steccherinum ochraceum TaxID=92696 RepID=A0A4R0RRS6_9APHY|nr:hypothetical protein EIP91_002861 [Steccherinum ochraceum]